MGLLQNARDALKEVGLGDGFLRKAMYLGSNSEPQTILTQQSIAEAGTAPPKMSFAERIGLGKDGPIRQALYSVSNSEPQTILTQKSIAEAVAVEPKVSFAERAKAAMASAAQSIGLGKDGPLRQALYSVSNSEPQTILTQKSIAEAVAVEPKASFSEKAKVAASNAAESIGLGKDGIVRKSLYSVSNAEPQTILTQRSIAEAPEWKEDPKARVYAESVLKSPTISMHAGQGSEGWASRLGATLRNAATQVLDKVTAPAAGQSAVLQKQTFKM